MKYVIVFKNEFSDLINFDKFSITPKDINYNNDDYIKFLEKNKKAVFEKNDFWYIGTIKQDKLSKGFYIDCGFDKFKIMKFVNY